MYCNLSDFFFFIEKCFKMSFFIKTFQCNKIKLLLIALYWKFYNIEFTFTQMYECELKKVKIRIHPT